ncbi:hypothetical protein [Nocardia sp. CNY236]|nr:hypothetical protein [Nocardia sp. CNY236]
MATWGATFVLYAFVKPDTTVRGPAATLVNAIPAVTAESSPQ